MLNLPHLQTNVPLGPFTTYQIGGLAEYFVGVTSSQELAAAVRVAREANVPYFVLGCGANILIKDGGMKGLVIYNKANHVEFIPSRHQVWAESGAQIADLIEVCRDKGLSGFEHFVGIPSTVGGAIWQNLHFLSPDRERTMYIEEFVLGGRILDENNKIQVVDKKFFQFGYDDTILHHRKLIVLDVLFQLAPKSPSEIQAQMIANMNWRAEKQPQLWQWPSCGSVFQKIEGVGAGRLIDEAGLKGHRIGNAQISEKHANYIVNLGGATARDVLDLIELVRAEVKAKTGYELTPEIGIIGEG
ncbi:MAG TPA: UDP-N-acetylmuramate dehydrogenase [Patescibacteria group bacterium]